MARQGAGAVPLVISASGLGQAELEILTEAVNFVGEQGISCRFIGNNSLQGHLVVVDIDTDQGLTALSQLRQGQVKMLVARQPRFGKNIVSITKPLDRDELGMLLARVCFRLQLQLEKSVRQREEAEPGDARAETGETLFQPLLDARQKKLDFVVGQHDQPVLIVEGAHDVVRTTLDAHALRDLMGAPSRELSISMDGEGALMGQSEAWKVIPMDHILWSAGLQWHSGTLLPGLQMEQCFKLKAWPNFTRTDFSPEHLKLSALLASRPMSPSQIVAIAGVEIEQVICFINAAYAVGLLYVDTQSAPAAVDHPVRDAKRQGLLTRLARHLGF